MQVRSVSLVLISFALAACYPRQPVAPPPPPPPPPPPAPAISPAEEAVLRMQRAQRAFDEGVRLGRQSRWADAADRYRLAAEAVPNEPRYHLALSDALLAQGREWEAADALLAGIRAEENGPDPNHRVLAVDYERLIRLLTRLNRMDEARDAASRQAQHRRLRDSMVPPE
jgi:tetratricopeptide (TPR) repeat protein